MNETQLSKEAFLSASDIRIEKVLVPELRQKPDDPKPVMYVKVMSGLEFEGYMKSTRPMGNFVWEHSQAKLLVRTLCDASGNRLFTDDDIESVSKKSYAVLARLAEAARDLNGLGPKKVEDAAKN